jgi:hypothetical protein
MSSYPPHLPQKASSLKQRYLLQQVPWLLFFVSICAITAVAVSMVLFAWYIPSYVSYHVPTGVQRTIAIPEVASVDPFFVKEIESKIVQIHKGKSDTPPRTISEESFVAHAALLSSDGWVAFVSEPIDMNVRLFAVDTHGVVHDLSQKRMDALSGITYAKIDGDGYRVMPFELGEPSESMYVRTAREWNTILGTTKPNRTAETPMLHMPSYVRSVDAGTGSLVIHANGGLLGFVDNNNTIVPVWWVQDALSAVFSGEVIEHRTLPYAYREVTQVFNPTRGVYESIQGVEIVSSPFAATSSTLAIGDVIVRIGNETVDPYTLARSIQTAAGSVSFDVYRAGSMVTIVLE